MEPISELLDRVQESEQARIIPQTVYYRWMVEATNRIQELQHRLDVQAARLRVLDDDEEITPEVQELMDTLLEPKRTEHGEVPKSPMVEEACVYAAFRSYPDFHAPAPQLVSIHLTEQGAIHALYPENTDAHKNFREAFRKTSEGVWQGPDGFGMVKKMAVTA
jgi:hypothetical protein